MAGLRSSRRRLGCFAADPFFGSQLYPAGVRARSARLRATFAAATWPRPAVARLLRPERCRPLALRDFCGATRPPAFTRLLRPQHAPCRRSTFEAATRPPCLRRTFAAANDKVSRLTKTHDLLTCGNRVSREKLRLLRPQKSREVRAAASD